MGKQQEPVKQPIRRDLPTPKQVPVITPPRPDHGMPGLPKR
jgi:hypothetical protein